MFTFRHCNTNSYATYMEGKLGFSSNHIEGAWQLDLTLQRVLDGFDRSLHDISVFLLRRATTNMTIL